MGCLLSLQGSPRLDDWEVTAPSKRSHLADRLRDDQQAWPGLTWLSFLPQKHRLSNGEAGPHPSSPQKQRGLILPGSPLAPHASMEKFFLLQQTYGGKTVNMPSCCLLPLEGQKAGNGQRWAQLSCCPRCVLIFWALILPGNTSPHPRAHSPQGSLLGYHCAKELTTLLLNWGVVEMSSLQRLKLTLLFSQGSKI